jgi:hypothetical protein
MRPPVPVLGLLGLLGLLDVCDSLVVPPPVVSFACGGVAGAVGAVAVYPIDFAKTQLQTAEGRRKYSGGVEVLRSVLQEHGPLGPYRGLGPQVTGVAPEKAVKLFVNDAASKAIASACGGSLPVVGEAAAGCVAGLAQVVITNPLESVKIRLQTSRQPLGDVLAELGLDGLYRGAGACMARDATFSAVLFPTYAHAKLLLVGASPDAAASTTAGLALALAGLAAAAPAAAVTTPFDVVKTRMQAAPSTPPPPPSSPPPSSTTAARTSARRVLPSMATGTRIGTDASSSPAAAAAAVSSRGGVLGVATAIARDEGPSVLFDGALERVLRSAPQFAVTLSVADLLKASAHAHGWM